MKRFKSLVILFVILIFSGMILTMYFACTQNTFGGIGENPDIKAPTIDIKTPNNNDTVVGTITLSGNCHDDLRVSKIEVCYLYIDNTGRSIKNVIGTADIANGKWEYRLNTGDFDDGSKIFKIIAYDKSGKSSEVNITLILNNYGPVITINEPTGIKPIASKFTTVITLNNDVDVSVIDWEIVSKDDPNIKIGNTKNVSIAMSGGEAAYSFEISNIIDLKNNYGFNYGECLLRIRGKDINNKYSKNWAEKTIIIDFRNDSPVIELSYPAETDLASAKTYSSDFTVAGNASDDDAVKAIELWYKKVGEPDTSAITVTLDYSADPKTYQVFSKNFTGLTDGAYVIKAKAIDINNTESAYTELHYFKINSNFPVITFTNPPYGSWQRDVIHITANITSPGSNIAEIKVKIDENGTYTHYDSPGTNSYNFDAPFDTVAAKPGGGEIRYFISVEDQLGNTTINSILFNVDNTAPSGTIDYPADPNSGLNQIVRLQGTARDEDGAVNSGIQSVKLNIEGIGDVTPNGLASWSYDFDTSAIALDTRTLTVTITDIAGNTYVTTRELNIDQNADKPIIHVNNLNENDKIYGMFTITGDAQDDDAVKNVVLELWNSTGTVKLDTFYASGTTSWSYKFDTTAYATGQYILKYVAYDIYNKPSDVGSINFYIDPDLPVIYFTSHAENDAIKANTTISGYVDKTTGKVSAIEIRLQGNNYTQNWTSSGLTITGLNTFHATYSYNVNTTTYGEGPIIISIRARDDINKENTLIRNLVIDTQRPSGNLTLPIAGTIYSSGTVSFAGVCSDPTPTSGLSSENILINVVNKDTTEVTSVVDGSAPEIINGSISNWTYTWNVPALQKDGLYEVRLIVTDRAGNNAVQDASHILLVDNIRLARYVPQLSNLYINGVPAADNIYITANCNFTGDISDIDGNDLVKGVKRVEIYLSNNDIIDAGDLLITSRDYTGANTTESFSLNYTFTSSRQYLIYRAIDKVGGYKDNPIRVNIDFTAPSQAFKYTSRDYAPSVQSANPGYSSLYWIKLDATDNNDMSGSVVQIKLGITSGGDEIAGLQTFAMGDYFKIDLHDYTDTPIYLWYKLRDKAGNETTNVLSLARDTNMPALISNALSKGYLNNAGLSVSGTATGGGKNVISVKFSSVDGDLTTGIDANSYSPALPVSSTTWSYNIPAPGGEGEHYIYALVTADDGTNWYEKYDFIYDVTSPSTTVSLIQLSNEGRVVGDNLSGTVRFTGVYTDNYDDKYNESDVVITLNIGTKTFDVTNKTKNPDGSITWIYDWNTQLGTAVNGFDVVASNLAVSVTCMDVAGNSFTQNMTNKNVVPYITSITEEQGKVVSVYGFNSVSGLWENLNDNQTYTYRRGSGNITINGYNLNAAGSTETITYTRKSNGATHTWNGFTQDMNAITFDPTWTPASEVTHGELKISVGGVDSNSKKIYVIYNYPAPTGFAGIAETDMVLDDTNNARVAVQKHFIGQSTYNITRSGRTYNVEFNGSGLYKFKETSENTFDATTLNQDYFLAHGYNRFWFINLAKDIGTAAQTDGKFYLFTDDSENYEGPTKGLMLMGDNNFWDTLPYIHKHISNYNPIWQPVNDWNTNPTPSNNTGSQYRNRWRMSATNNYNGDSNLYDWSVTWGDIIAKDDIVYTVWFSQYDNTMRYRRLNNLTNNSTKSPAGSGADGSINFTIKGSYPAITLDTSGRPVIACFNESSNGGDLTIYAASNTDPQTAGNFTATIVSTVSVIDGAYPDIAIDGSGGVHVVYQDTTNGTLKYLYASSVGNLQSGTYSTIVIDNDAAPGFYCDLRLMPNNKPSVTYLSFGYTGTKNALRTARFTAGDSDFTNMSKWERFTLPSANDITENKVRGYYVDAANDWLFGFAKSDRPEFFREKP